MPTYPLPSQVAWEQNRMRRSEFWWNPLLDGKKGATGGAYKPQPGDARWLQNMPFNPEQYRFTNAPPNIEELLGMPPRELPISQKGLTGMMGMTQPQGRPGLLTSGTPLQAKLQAVMGGK